MTTNLFRGFLTATAVSALLVASGAQAADAPAKKGPTVSAPVGKALQVAQKAQGTKDWAAAQAAIDQAKAAAGRTPYDDYEIARFSTINFVNLNNVPSATEAAIAAADSPAMPETEKPQVLKVAVILTLNNKQYDKAVAYSKLLEPTNPTDPSTILAMIQAYSLGKDYADGVRLGQKVVDTTVAPQKPDHDILEMLMTDQVSVKDEAGAEKTLEMLVADYNRPDDWAQMIDITLGTKGLRDVDAVWLGRLLVLSGGTVSPQDASIFGQTASHLTFFGDTDVARQHGGTGLPDDTAKMNADKKTMPAQIAAGQKANGNYNVKLAEALYGYGMYPEAEAAARLGIQKGGALDSSEGPMVLGQSLLAQGKTDDAIAAFGQVTGGGPATPRIVRLWVDYANIKKSPPATAAK